MSSNRDETSSFTEQQQVTDPTMPAVSMPVEELPRGTAVDRYLVVQRLGEGGMGVVYAAYDAELDRKVALKLLRGQGDDAEGHARLLREAQAMARVSHPNVIAIHDVGSFRDRVFMAMDLVEGSTLYHWAKEKGRPWAEVARAFLDAGRGLAAAHAAGLVHRDFKPQNVLIGRDGRVFVTDFGLARMAEAGAREETVAADASERETEVRSPLDTSLTGDGVVLGTPRYMSPEQHLALSVDARADQFSFCASLYWALWRTHPFDPVQLAERARQLREAGAGARARSGMRGAPGSSPIREPPSQPRVPARLRRAVMRGLALEPEKRFPGMEPLLSEIGAALHPPSRQVALAAAALAGVLVVGGGAWAYRDRAQSQLCSGGAAEIGGVWNPAVAAGVQSGFAAVTPERGPELSRQLVMALDGYAVRWAQAHREACEATRIRGEQTETTLSLRMTCLDRRRKELAALVRLLERPDAALVDRAIDATQGLSAIGQCGDLDALAQVGRPEDPARRASLEKLEEQLARVAALRNFGRYPEGLEEARAAVAVSRALAFKPLEAQARLELGWLLDYTGDQPAAMLELHEALRLAEAGRDDVTKVRVACRLSYMEGYRNLDFTRGVDWARLSLAMLDRLGADRYPELDSGANNILGLVQMRAGKLREALAAFQRSLSPIKSSTGADLLRARALANIAVSRGALGEYREAVSDGRLAITHFERLRGPDHPVLVEPLQNVAEALRQVGRLDEALASADRALRLAETKLGRDHPTTGDVLDTRSDVLLEQGRAREALVDAERAQAIHRAKGAPVAEAFSLNTIGRAQLQLGRVPEAIASLERAASLQPPDASVMADIEFGLARALAAANRDPARARALAGSARSRFEELHQSRRLVELDGWLAALGTRARR